MDIRQTPRYVNHTNLKISGFRYVIADIHACPKTLARLLEHILLIKKNDAVYLLGDYLTKGVSNRAVLDYIMGLQNTGYQIFPLMGNHEEMVLRMYRRAIIQKEMQTFQKGKYADLLAPHGWMNAEILAWLNDLPTVYELKDCFLVHAGFNLMLTNPFTDQHAMRWIRDMPKPKMMPYFPKRIIHGHVLSSIKTIRKRVAQKAKIIPLDNGCVYHGWLRKGFDQGDLGRLCCLNLDTFELVWQTNIDY